ncbi:MAG: hypothetical protein LBC74_10900 [Planctomycetaceae bacterium]|nr:hypothetical protein [Planctomycetaceae bacterium]
METEINDSKFKCPTCAKVQEWRDTCKLCGSDVSQLRSLAVDYIKLQKRLRAILQNGNLIYADELAQQLISISPTTLNKKIHKFLKSLILKNATNLANPRRFSDR